MNTFIDFIKTLYSYTKNKLILSVSLSVCSSLMNGISILMLIPLLSLSGLIDGIQKQEGFLQKISNFFVSMPKISSLALVLVLYITLIVVDALLKQRISILNTQITQKFARSLSGLLYEKATLANWFCLRSKKKSDLVNAFTVEVSRVGTGAMYFLNIVSQIVVSIIHISIALYMSVPVTLSVLICGVLFFLYMNTSVKESKKLGSSLYKINKSLFSQVTEQIHGIKEIKSYGIENDQIKRFKNINNQLENIMVDFVKLQSRPDFYYKIGAALIVSICFFCAIIFFKVNTVALLIIIYIFSRLWPLFSSFQGNIQNIFVVLPSFKEFTSLCRAFSEASEKQTIENENPCIKINDRIKFENVKLKFSHTDNEHILKGISFEIPQKSMTAIVGHSGAGKSTVADILVGLLSPTSGCMTVDGNEINKGNMHKWRQSIGYVSQEVFIINDTIRENLSRFNPNASENEMLEALELSAARDFVDKLSLGLDTVIGDKGVKLSGGEKQRIVLARCLLRKPELLVLDEATSSLDNENELKIQKAIENFKGKMTVVVIAHRLSTIRNADNVIALENGEIINSEEYLANNADILFDV